MTRRSGKTMWTRSLSIVGLSLAAVLLVPEVAVAAAPDPTPTVTQNATPSQTPTPVDTASPTPSPEPDVTPSPTSNPVPAFPTPVSTDIPGVTGPEVEGKRPSAVTPKIVGGDQATIADAPWQVALIAAAATSEFAGQFCGGSLIASQWVLTAAHCVVSSANVVSTPATIKVLAGQSTLSTTINNRAVAISNIYVHPLYAASAHHDDIALLKLTTAFTFVSGRIQKIDLPPWTASPGGPDLITGWGAMESGVNSYPTILRKATVDVIDDSSCLEYYPDSFDPKKMLCAGSDYLDRDTCQGDSGGPIAYESDTWVLEGVTSYGIGCGSGYYPGVYTEVYNYESWINQYLATSPAISGRLTVKDSATATALAKAEVFLLPAVDPFCADYSDPLECATWTVTDSNGNYSILPPDDGDYVLAYYPPSSRTANLSYEYFNDKPEYHAADVISFSSTSITGKDALLSPYASIKGRVTYLDGATTRNASEIEVCAYTTAESAADANSPFCAYSAADGTYSLDYLPSGSYRLFFNDIYGYYPDVFSAWWTSTGGVTDYSSATPVTIAGGVSVTSKNLLLQGPLSVSGKVTYTSGATTPALADAEVVFFDAFTGDWVGSTTTDSSGNYTYIPDSSGSFKIFVDPWQSNENYSLNLVDEWFQDKPDISQATVVPFSTTSVTGKNVNLSPAATISGRVTYLVGATATAAEGVSVCAYFAIDSFTNCASTDSSGNYAIPGVANGSYKLYFDATDAPVRLASAWLGSSGPVATYASAATLAVTTSGLSLTGKNVALAVPPNISGKVNYLSGGTVTPISGAIVEAYNSSGELIEQLTTDGAGFYMFYPPAAGSYFLKFADDGNLGLSPEWHSDKPDQSVATAIVFGTASIANTNAVLSAPAGISGRVTYPVDGVSTAFAGAYVCAYVTADVNVSCATSDETGAYSIQGLPSGSYKLYFDVSQTGTTDAFSAWWGQAANFGAATAFTIANGNSLTGKNLALPIPATISGTVTANLTGTLEPLAGINVTAYDSTYGQVSSATTDESGHYKLPGLAAGSFKLEFTNTVGLNVFGEWYNNADGFSSATAVAVTASQQLTGKDVELARGASLSGVVTNGGVPLEGADVTIRRLSPYGYCCDEIGTVTTDASGTFRMQGLAAGTYYAQFSAGSSGADVATAYLGGVRKQENATQIRLSAGQEKTDIDFAMITGGSISGTVVAKATSMPVQNGTVEIYDVDGQSVASTYIDGSGNYSLTGVFPESYSLRASAGSHQDSSVNLADEWWSGHSSVDGANLLAVESGGQHVANFALEAGSVISGFITGDMGDGNGALPVQAFVAVYTKSAGGGTQVPVNESGYYELGGLQPGTYFVCAGGDSGDIWPQTCAGGFSKMTDSDPVVLGAQTTVSDVNIDLVRGGQISGTITNSATGSPYANGYVSLYGVGGATFSLFNAYTDEAGVFSLSNIPAGKYFLYVQGGWGQGGVISEYYNDKYSKETASAITVTSGSEIVANMTVGTAVVGAATVTGRVTNSAGTGLAGVRVSTRCTQVNFGWASATTAADGTYRLENLTPGACTLTYESYSWEPPTSSFNVLGATRTATLIAGPNALSAQVLSTGGSITGKVTTLSGAPVVMGVAVYSVASNSCVGFASTDASGNFTLGGLPTGTYKVVATGFCAFSGNGGRSGDLLNLPTAYEERWFGGTGSYDTSTPISVTAGTATTGKNIVVVQGATLSGDVVISHGESQLSAPTRISVSLKPVGGPVEYAYPLKSNSQDNSFSISAIPSGDYNVAVNVVENSNSQQTIPYSYLWRGADGTGAPEVVHIDAGQVVTDFHIVMPAPATLKIKLKVPTSWASGCNQISIWNADSPYSSGYFSGAFDGVRTIAPLQPGSYKLSVQCGGATLWYGGTSKATASDIVLAPGQSLSGLTWDVSASAENLGAISGRVTRTFDGRPAGISGAKVILFTTAGVPVAETSSSDDGSYFFAGLPDGAYKVQFNGASNADGNITPFAQSEWWNNATSRATSSTVTIATAANVTGIDALLSDATGKVIEGTPAITGTTRVGQTLTVATGTWTTGTTFNYQWYRGDEIPIAGATASTYVLQAQDNGQFVYCRILGEKSGLQPSTTWAYASGVISGTAMTPGTATITGTAAIGSTLTANKGTWTPASPTFSYQWRRGAVDIPGATDATYVVKPADAGYAISVVVIGSASSYQNTAATSAATATVVAGTLTTATPTISGTPTVGSELTGVPGTWGPSPVTLAYEWKRGTTVVGTGLKYTVVSADVGQALTFKVSGTKEGFTPASMTSTAVTGQGVWTQTPTPVISGTPTFGNTLQVTTPNLGTWSPTPTSYSYQWKKNGANITGANAASYVLAATDVGATISVSVTGVLANYAASPQTSLATDQIAAATFTTTPVPTITGTKNVGQTLSAVTGTWAPVPTSYSYQWYRGETPIGSPTTTGTYTLVGADLGQQIKVSVTAVKAGYTSPSPVSLATTAIDPALFTTAQVPTISGTAKVGTTLTAASTAWVPAVDSYTYQWNRAGVAIESDLAKTSSYVVVPEDLGRAITVTVTGKKTGYVDTPKVSLATVAVVAGTFATPPVPTISGTLKVGETLTANEGTWSPTQESFTYSWQWSATAAGTFAAISGATAKTYALQATDRGRFIKVVVTAVKTSYTSGVSTSAASAAVAADFTTAPTPTITLAGGGSPAVGNVLTAVTGTWSPSTITTPSAASIAYTYVWKRNGAPISGAIASTYTVTAADVGQPISVAVTATLSTYVTTTKVSAATANVAKGTFTTTPVPTISGAAISGTVLTAVPGVWAPVQDSFTYQWTVGSTPVAGSAGTGPIYTVQPADAGSTITVTVTAKKAGYEDSTKTSLSTALVTLPLIAAVPTPTISGTVKVGSTLTAAPGTAPSGATVKSYQWSWAATATGVYSNISEASSSTYVLKPADLARFIKVTVTWSKTGNGDTPALSAATAVVAAGTFVTPPVPTISGTVRVGETLTANEGTWSPIQDSFTYVWQWSATATGTYAAISGATGKSYALQAADRGRFIKVVVTAVKSGFTSGVGTSIASAAVNAPFTTAPTPTIAVTGGGVAAVGKVLTAVPGTWAPSSITTPSVASIAYSYVWKRNGAAITSATAASYTLVAADLGAAITVAVTATLNTYVTTTKESAATASVVKGAFTTSPTPVITGTPIAGQVLAITLGTWAPVQDSFAYQWSVNGTPVTDGTGVAATYTVKAADAGSTITVTVTAKKAGYDDMSKTSLATALVTLPLIATAPTPTFTPTTLLKPGVMLTANAGTAPTGATVKGYQWSRATTSTGVFTNIPDATLNTYTLTGADAAKYLKVTVTWSKAGNADTPKVSAATMLIAVGTFATTATPTITGSVNVGSTVTANEGAWSPTPDSYTYKWYISTTAAATYTLISGATNRTYLVASGDVNKFLKVEITAVKTGYTTSVAFRSGATAAVGPALPQ